MWWSVIHRNYQTRRLKGFSDIYPTARVYSVTSKTLLRLIWCNFIQYFPRNMHTVTALLCFVVVKHCLMFPYPSGLLRWHCGNLTIAPVPAKQPWWIRINTSCEFIMNDCITTTKQSTTKPCAYFLGYTVVSRGTGAGILVTLHSLKLYDVARIADMTQDRMVIMNSKTQLIVHAWVFNGVFWNEKKLNMLCNMYENLAYIFFVACKYSWDIIALTFIPALTVFKVILLPNIDTSLTS